MDLTWQIVIAAGLDLLIGDPKWFPHPVRLMGGLALRLEDPARRIFPDEGKAGTLVTIIVIAAAAFATWLLLACSSLVHPFLGDLASIYLLYSGLAVRDMVKHSSAVYRALAAGSLEEARRLVSLICGRDTDVLDGSGVSKAAVESVAENMVDGVTAPLFFAVLGGPVAMMAYKAVNTLDSTFGYKNDRYLDFGRTPAKLDDAANFIPARLTALLVPLAARILGEDSSESFRIFLRDRGRHPSPNAGQTEAAVAGALNIQLGGLSYYGGQPSDKPKLGDPVEPIDPSHIPRANAMLVITSVLVLTVLLVLRYALVSG